MSFGGKTKYKKLDRSKDKAAASASYGKWKLEAPAWKLRAKIKAATSVWAETLKIRRLSNAKIKAATSVHAEALQLVCEQKTLTIRRLLNAKIQAATSVQAEALQLVCEQKCCNKNARMQECKNAIMQ